MSLRNLAESDLATVLEDGATGFGWPITLTDPAGQSNADPIFGSSTDIEQMIDPDTGQLVNGRAASVAVRLSTLAGAGFSGVPRGVADSKSKPWLVTVDDIGGQSRTFKVRQSNPDRALGVVVCILEAYSE